MSWKTLHDRDGVSAFFCHHLAGGGCVFGRGKSGQLIPFRLAPLADRKEEPFSFSLPRSYFFAQVKRKGKWREECKCGRKNVWLRTHTWIELSLAREGKLQGVHSWWKLDKDSAAGVSNGKKMHFTHPARENISNVSRNAFFFWRARGFSPQHTVY